MFKVFVLDKFLEIVVQIFCDCGVDVDYLLDVGKDKEKLVEIIGQYDGLVIWLVIKVMVKLLENVINLKVIGCVGIGVDNVEILVVLKKGVIVMNMFFGNLVMMVEYVIVLMFVVVCQLFEVSVLIYVGKWEKNCFMGVEVFNKMLGIIGVGNIGLIVIDWVLGLKMKVLVYDFFLLEEWVVELGVKKVELDEMLVWVDFIMLYVLLIDKIKNILLCENLLKIKKGVCIVNVVCGGLIDEVVLVELL